MDQRARTKRVSDFNKLYNKYVVSLFLLINAT